MGLCVSCCCGACFGAGVATVAEEHRDKQVVIVDRTLAKSTNHYSTTKTSGKSLHNYRNQHRQYLHQHQRQQPSPPSTVGFIPVPTEVHMLELIPN